MPIVFLTGQATPDLRKSDGCNVTRCAGKDKEIVFALVFPVPVFDPEEPPSGSCWQGEHKKTPRKPERLFCKPGSLAAVRSEPCRLIHTLGKAEQIAGRPESRAGALAQLANGFAHVFDARDPGLTVDKLRIGFAQNETREVEAGRGCIDGHLFYSRTLCGAQCLAKTTNWLKIRRILGIVLRCSIALNAWLGISYDQTIRGSGKKSSCLSCFHFAGPDQVEILDFE
jgi:hypothetical protein